MALDRTPSGAFCGCATQSGDPYIADRTASSGLFYEGQKMVDEESSSALVHMRDELS